MADADATAAVYQSVLGSHMPWESWTSVGLVRGTFRTIHGPSLDGFMAIAIADLPEAQAELVTGMRDANYEFYRAGKWFVVRVRQYGHPEYPVRFLAGSEALCDQGPLNVLQEDAAVSDLTCVALVAIADPMRSDIHDAHKQFREVWPNDHHRYRFDIRTLFHARLLCGFMEIPRRLSGLRVRAGGTTLINWDAEKIHVLRDAFGYSGVPMAFTPRIDGEVTVTYDHSQEQSQRPWLPSYDEAYRPWLPRPLPSLTPQGEHAADYQGAFEAVEVNDFRSAAETLARGNWATPEDVAGILCPK